VSYHSRASTVFAILVAGVVFLCPLKFSQFVILDSLTPRPQSLLDFIFRLWPLTWFYLLVPPLVLLALLVPPHKFPTKLFLAGPLALLGVEILSAAINKSWELSTSIIWFHAALLAAFFIGWKFRRSRIESIEPLLFGWLTSLIIILWVGWLQQKEVIEQGYQLLQQDPAGYRTSEWLADGRVFGTFISPNSFGAFLIGSIFVIPLWCIEHEGKLSSSWRNWIPKVKESLPKLIFGGLLLVFLLFILWHTRSKGSYLVLFTTLGVMGLLIFRRMPSRVIFISVCLILGGMGWFLGYGGRVVNGEEVSALETASQTGNRRIQFWSAAVRMGMDNPLLGTGPGTFGKHYPEYMESGWKKSLFVHNAYLQAWSDAGIFGTFAYSMWIILPLAVWWRRRRHDPLASRWHGTLLWLCGFAFAAHIAIDFHNYMISNSWPVFLFLGWLAGDAVDEGDSLETR
jgi:O-antigen ligase